MGLKDIRACVVGDVGVGKKCLLWAIEGVRSPLDYIKIPNISPKEIYRKNKKYRVTFSYVTGNDEYKKLRQFAYQSSHVFLLCFSFDNKKSYENLVVQWIQEIKQYRSNASIILVGTKSDLKDHTLRRFWSFSKNEKFKMKIDADYYIECSSKTKENIDEICEKIVAAYLIKNTKKNECIIT